MLHIDASGNGQGAVLYQKQVGKEHVKAYATRKRASTCIYPAHKVEFLALKWTVCDNFNGDLYGNRFTVKTDNNL